MKLLILLLLPAICQAQLFPNNKRLLNNAVPAAIDTIKVNMWDSISGLGSVSGGEYNNVCWPVGTPGNGVRSKHLTKEDGTQTTVQVAWWQNGVTTRAKVSDVNNRSSVGNYGTGHTTPFDYNCFYITAYNNVADNSDLIISGLDNSKTYDILILTSRQTATNPLNTTWSYGATTATVNASSNITTWVQLDGLSPSSGEININADYASGFSFVTALMIVTHN